MNMILPVCIASPIAQILPDTDPCIAQKYCFPANSTELPINKGTDAGGAILITRHGIDSAFAPSYRKS